MLQTSGRSNHLYSTALALLLAVTLNSPKVDAKTIENITQLPASSVITAAPAWKEFSSSEGKYSVLFPNEDVFEMSPPKGAMAPGIKSFKMHAVSDKNSVFIVGYADFSVDISQLPADELLNAFMEGMLQGKSKLLSQTNIQLGQYQGKEVNVRDEEQGMTYKTRVFLVGQKIYFLMVGSAQTPQISDTQKFFDSFELVN
jgi:hypothetical protein